MMNCSLLNSTKQQLMSKTTSRETHNIDINKSGTLSPAANVLHISPNFTQTKTKSKTKTQLSQIRVGFLLFDFVFLLLLYLHDPIIQSKQIAEDCILSVT